MPGTNQPQQLIGKATALYHSGEYREAIQVWQEVLRQDPDNQRAKEGIRMASLLLEEAQTSERADRSPEQPEAPESPEVIAKVRAGIQKVRDSLAVCRHLDAMEVCQSLLQLAPRSQAVREVLDEAREAYEAQPFIGEHLEIARQLFVQERLDEASAEIQKIFFLNPNHAEARKLDAKIQALRQKQSSTEPLGAPAEREVSPSATASDTQRIQVPPEVAETLGRKPELLEPEAVPHGGEKESAAAAPQPGAIRSKKQDEEPVLNENWEAELAQLGLAPAAGPAPGEPSAGSTPEAESMPLTDLSEDPADSSPSRQSRRGETPRTPSATGPPRGETDLSELPQDLFTKLPAEMPARGEDEVRPRASAVKIKERPRPVRESPSARRRGGLPLAKIAFGLLVLLAAAGGGWWLLGQRSASASGQGGGSRLPPKGQVPLNPHTAGRGEPGSANVGLSSNSSRPGNAAALQTEGPAPLPGAPASPAPSPQDIQRQISGLFATGKAQSSRGSYSEAVVTFSKILDLDPANIEAKEQLDLAAGKVQEQKRLEEDLQTAKQYFVEKDYESALRKFYRLPKDHNLGELQLFIRNAWYNWAVVSMKGGNCPEALKRLDEALNLDSDDPEAAKLREVADHYRDRPKDSVFYAYVDRLTYRTLNQK